MKLLIRGLSTRTNEETVKKLFEEFGVVQYCNIVLDADTNISKGFGFVEMPKVGDAKQAVKMLNNREVDGQVIRVKKAAPKPVQDQEEPKSTKGTFKSEKKR